MFEAIQTNYKASFICITLLLVSCANETSKVYDTVKLTESYKHQELIAELKKNDVDYYLNQDGSVSYNTAQTSLVDNIKKTIHKKYSYGIHVFEANYEKLITDELTKEEIPFKVIVKDNDRWILWGESYHQKAKMVLDEIHRKSYRKEIQVEKE